MVLDKLGVEDFGIFNVVGGLAAMFTFFSSSLSNATQRFLNIELGQDNLNGAKNVFSQYFLFYCIIAIVVIVAAETIGLWFVWNKLVIPPDRVVAAVCVYQFTVVYYVDWHCIQFRDCCSRKYAHLLLYRDI